MGPVYVRGDARVTYAGDSRFVRIHARIRHQDEHGNLGTWDSRDDNDFSACDLGEGIETFGNFFEIPREWKVLSWYIFVEGQEQRNKNVRVSKYIRWPVHNYREPAE